MQDLLFDPTRVGGADIVGSNIRFVAAAGYTDDENGERTKFDILPSLLLLLVLRLTVRNQYKPEFKSEVHAYLDSRVVAFRETVHQKAEI